MLENTPNMKKLFFTVVLFSAIAVFAKNEPPIVVTWPAEHPSLKFTFDKLRVQGSYGGQSTYSSSVTVENLTDAPVTRTSFVVSFFDKNEIRIGQTTLLIADLDPRRLARQELQFNTVGVPQRLTISAPTKTIPLKILSVPSGADLKVDGQDVGFTPLTVRLTVGLHHLDLFKEGYAVGHSPLDVAADELPGGSITIELGGLSRDSIELRDGTHLLGDVISMSMTEVVVRIDGKDQTYPRNQVKQLILVERIVGNPVSGPSPSNDQH